MFTLSVGLESDPTIQVYSYINPVTALLEFKPDFYDLLLIDVNMPFMDGFQLANKLCANARTEVTFWKHQKGHH